jgi:uncharacterized integral membrane protein
MIFDFVILPMIMYILAAGATYLLLTGFDRPDNGQPVDAIIPSLFWPLVIVAACVMIVLYIYLRCIECVVRAAMKGVDIVERRFK